jgi:SAM-dependent methyltransferase
MNDFDIYATEYDTHLNRGLSITGESKDYFARARIAWLAGCLGALRTKPRVVLDYGCGTGSSIPFILELVEADRVIGVDTSRIALDIARRSYGSDRVRFSLLDQYRPNGEVDLAFCNGVFHHIPPKGRIATLDYIHCALRPEALFALWENNPANPGTRYVMSRIPFDRDANPDGGLHTPYETAD